MFSNSELVGHLGRSMGMTKSRSNSGASRPSTKPPIFKAVRLPREAPVRLKTDPIRGEERVEVEFRLIVATRDEITHSITKSKRFYGGASNDEDGLAGLVKEREKANQPTKMDIDPIQVVVDNGQRFAPPVRPAPAPPVLQRPPAAVQQVHVRPAAIAPLPITLEELNRAHARAAAAEAAVAAAGANHAQLAYNNQRLAAELQRVAGRAHESELEVERTRTLFSEENKRISDELANTRAKVLELQGAHHNSAKGRASAETQAAAAREHIKTLAAELGELRQKESQLEKLSAALEKSNASAEAAHAKAEAREKGWQLSAANEARAVKRAQELEVQIAQLQADNGALAFRSSAMSDSSKDALRELATRNGALEASRIQLNDEKFRISEELVQMRERVQDLESKHHSSARARAAAEAHAEEAHVKIAALTKEMSDLRRKESQISADKGALAFRSSVSSEQLAAFRAARAIIHQPVKAPAELAPLVVGRRPRSAGAQQAALDGVDAFAALGSGEGAREHALARRILVQQQKALAVQGGVAKRPASAGALKRAPLVLPPPKFGALGAPSYMSTDIVPAGGGSGMDDIDEFPPELDPTLVETYKADGTPSLAWYNALSRYLQRKGNPRTVESLRRIYPMGEKSWRERFEPIPIGRDMSPPKRSMPPKKKAHA